MADAIESSSRAARRTVKPSCPVNTADLLRVQAFSTVSRYGPEERFKVAIDPVKVQGPSSITSPFGAKGRFNPSLIASRLD